MNRKNYTSIKRVLNDINIKSGNKIDLAPDDILYLANGIAEKIIPGDSFIEEMALIDINNYKGKLPSNCKYISQALYLVEEEHEVTKEEVTGWTKKIYGSDCHMDVEIKCDPCSDKCNTQIIKLDADYNYLISNPKWAYNHAKFFYGQRKLEDRNNHSNNRVDLDRFQLMRRTTNNFFNVPYHINECINFNNDSHVEYNIEYPNIITNFKKGTVLIAYLGIAVDDEGYRMIPDIEEVYDAIYYSIVEILSEQKVFFEADYANRMTHREITPKAAQARKRAIGILSTLEPDEWEMFIRNVWIRTVPYYKWEKTGNRYIGDKAYTKMHTLGDF